LKAAGLSFRCHRGSGFVQFIFCRVITMIKAIITDLDDTLLRYDKTISQFSLSILKRCRAKGIKLVIATARGGSAKQFVPFELFDGFVLMNGATAIVDNQKVYERLMLPEVFIPVLTKIDAANINVAVEINGIHHSNFAASNRKYTITSFDTINEKSEKFYAIVDTPDKVAIIKKLLPPELSVHFTEDNYALITHLEATKIKAISAILDFWNIPFKDTVAFGDASNDIDMLKKCGIGVAMGNAQEGIKAISDEMCGNCENDGVAKWLAERIL
jgi:Cof subfamily protein (haloacid dehalogenase superfamily)